MNKVVEAKTGYWDRCYLSEKLSDFDEI